MQEHCQQDEESGFRRRQKQKESKNLFESETKFGGLLAFPACCSYRCRRPPGLKLQAANSQKGTFRNHKILVASVVQFSLRNCLCFTSRFG